MEPGTLCSACSEQRKVSKNSRSTSAQRGPPPCKHAQKRLLQQGAGLVGKAAALVTPRRFVAALAAKSVLWKRNLPFLLSDAATTCPKEQLGGLSQLSDAGGFPAPLP